MSRFFLTVLLTLALVFVGIPWALSGVGGLVPYVFVTAGVVTLIWFIFGPEKKRT